MNLVISSIGISIRSLLLFSIVPFAWWFLKERKNTGFFKWIGLYKPVLECKKYQAVIIVVIYCFLYLFYYKRLYSVYTLSLFNDIGANASAKYAGVGISAIIPAFIENFIANGLAVEILFRGFLTKRLSEEIGMIAGCIVQAALFGAMQNLQLFAYNVNATLTYHVVLFLFNTSCGFLLAIFNEKSFNASIVPGILLHGGITYISSLSVAFLLK